MGVGFGLVVVVVVVWLWFLRKIRPTQLRVELSWVVVIIDNKKVQLYVCHLSGYECQVSDSSQL